MPIVDRRALWIATALFRGLDKTATSSENASD